MTPSGPGDTAPPSLLGLLRTATRADHLALEDGLALMRPPLSRSRFVEVLQGFHAFHQAWERRMADLIGDEAWLAPRRRLPLIERDLRALGAEVGRRAPFDLQALDSPSAAWGSVYVMEGSTLGGQVISKALRRLADWAPDGGLAYFNPYGRETGAMWRAFCERLEAEAPRLDTTAACGGARTAFRLLREGLAAPLEAAA